MLIDWFTIIAQIFNFLVLLLLLRRFLYRPILNAMQAREKQIAERLESAEQKHLQSEEERQRYQALNEELRQYYTQKQREAEDEVNAWRKQALHEARQEVEADLQTWRQSLVQEKEAFGLELRQFAVRQVYTIAGQALRNLADASLEERMLAHFVARLERGDLDLAHVISAAGDGLTLRSAFDLPDDSQRRVGDALRAHLGRDLPLRFEVVSELAAGIELVSPDGSQAAWNLKRYLEALEDDLSSQLLQGKVEA